jgi:hypothetical protein
MGEFIKLLISGTPVATLLAVVCFVVVISVAGMYLVAFRQGRSVSFWPPKIGEKNLSSLPAAVDTLEMDIEGIWGDTFPVKRKEGQVMHAAVLSIKKTDAGCSVQGQEFDENLDVLYDWESVAVKPSNPGKLEYLFNATKTASSGTYIEMKGYTLLRFPDTAGRRPETYSGHFVDVWTEGEEKIRTRPGHLKGHRFPDHEAVEYGQPGGRRLLAQKLLGQEAKG